MRLFLVLLAVLLGIAAGIGLTVASVGPAGRAFARMTGNWEFSSTSGSPDIDPYTRARVFAEGILPLAAGEGYALRTRMDIDGAALERRCSYRLTGPFPAARYWTVTLADTHGRLLANLADRFAFTSAEIVRESSGAFAIEIGPEPLPGNWLPTSGAGGGFELAIRFYETPLSATATQFDKRTLPALRKLGCR